jgi:hypothetical protein
MEDAEERKDPESRRELVEDERELIDADVGGGGSYP